MKETSKPNVRTTKAPLFGEQMLANKSLQIGFQLTVPLLHHALVMHVMIPFSAMLIMTLQELHTHQLITVILSLSNMDTLNGRINL